MQSKMERKSKGKVVVVVDGQAGSSGKGKVCGYLASRDRFGIAINNWMSNAGHTWVGDYGTKVMTQHLPTSIVNRAIIPVIGPGAAITPEILINEMRKYSDDTSGCYHPSKGHDYPGETPGGREDKDTIRFHI